MSEEPQISPDTPQQDEQSEEAQPWRYDNMGEWVEDYLLPMYSRPLDDSHAFRWHPRWWDNIEVCMRLEALWGTWEKARYEGASGLLWWFRDCLDPMMREIMSPRGPFHHYINHKDPEGEQTPAQGPSMPAEPAPHGLFNIGMDED